MGGCNWSTSGRSPRGRATASLSPLLANNGGAPWERLLAEESDKQTSHGEDNDDDDDDELNDEYDEYDDDGDDDGKKKDLINRSCQGRLSSYKLAAAVGQLRRECMV